MRVGDNTACNWAGEFVDKSSCYVVEEVMSTKLEALENHDTEANQWRI